MFSIPAIALRLGVAQRTVKVGLIALAVVVLVVGVGVLACSRDRSMIQAHDAKQDAAVLGGARAADQAADNAAAPREAQHAAEAAQVQEDIRNAVQAHPDEARRPSGPATNAALDRLRSNAARRDR